MTIKQENLCQPAPASEELGYLVRAKFYCPHDLVTATDEVGYEKDATIVLNGVIYAISIAYARNLEQAYWLQLNVKYAG